MSYSQNIDFAIIKTKNKKNKQVIKVFKNLRTKYIM